MEIVFPQNNFFLYFRIRFAINIENKKTCWIFEKLFEWGFDSEYFFFAIPPGSLLAASIASAAGQK